MDDVCYEFVAPLLSKYNLRYDDWVNYEDITEWDIHKFLKPECKNLFKEFATEEFFEGLSIPKDVAEWLSALNIVADIKFVTAGSSKTIPWRKALLKRNLDFFTDSMLVKLRDKWLLDMDACIDDNPNTCKAVRAYSPKTFVFQIAKPWNNNHGYDIQGALASITKSILIGEI